MDATAFLPAISQEDVDQAVQLIQQAYNPQSHLSSDDQRRLQQELFDVQKRPEAWGLVIPFLNHPDPNVQFFGAHTAQVKIARDWSSFPEANAVQLKDMIINLTGHAIAAGQSKVILRKLFVAISSLALKLAPSQPTQWPDWLVSSVQALSSLGASREHLLDFLAIVAEEIESADLLAPKKAAMMRSLLDAAPLVTQAIATCVNTARPRANPSELKSAMKCFEAWLGIFRADELTPLIPNLISLLSPISQDPLYEFDEEEFVLASDALQEIMSRSVLAGGAGTKTLTEPILLWCERYGGSIVEQTLNAGFTSEVSRSFCKLLTGLGDHSSQYLASHLASSTLPSPSPPDLFASMPLPPKSQLVQTFLRLLLSYTALPGYYGVDEDESEMTLGFWYLFQEALWNTDAELDQAELDSEAHLKAEKNQWNVAKAVYSELIKVLKRKVTWPPQNVLSSWSRDQRDKFQAYRRDVGDTLINAYYILRDEMLTFFVNDIIQSLQNRQGSEDWEDIEATLHCIMATQEAVPIEPNPDLSRLFSSEVLGRLPTTGGARVRRTMISLIGSYASWFTTQPIIPAGASVPSLLLNALNYVVSALTEPSLCLPAANALRDLCDSNRAALAPHIGAFGELHAQMTNIPDTEKAKVLQSIASVIQALPPDDEIPPIEAILTPVVAKLFEALQSSAQLPEEARAVAIQQLMTITGVARGLTRTVDSLLIFDESPEVQAEAQRMQQARNDPRVVRLREAILDAICRTVDLWSTDASISSALSDLFKAITALPTDVTLITLPAAPLLELVCTAAQRELNGVWLSLANMLITQLDPPALLPSLFKTTPTNEANAIALNVLGVLTQTALALFSQPGAMEANPDVVQAFFNCLEIIAQHFIVVFYQLPPDLFNALMQCSISALSLQERYSLVSACTFLASLVNRTATNDELSQASTLFVQAHGRAILRAILSGFAGVAPRSAMPNLIELLSAMITRYPAESKAWMAEILYADDFTLSKATPEAKERFLKSIFSSRSLRRTRDAAQQFTLVARGLEGSSFGYATVTM
ncbi:ARM repeat-containing protein [Panus rudis PR-1116 ss-1]|nr:ARM repeat-containing protein [Panus rudis PR-1116 ss-1]